MTDQLKINREIWLQALESGNFKQTKGTLKERLNPADTRNPECGFCCLGVAREVLFDEPQETYISNGYGINGGKDEDYNMVQKSLDIEELLFNDIMEMNDTEGKSFKEIAEILRYKWDQPKGSVTLTQDQLNLIE